MNCLQEAKLFLTIIKTFFLLSKKMQVRKYFATQQSSSLLTKSLKFIFNCNELFDVLGINHNILKFEMIIKHYKKIV